MSTWVDDPVAEVRRRADIVEVISGSVVLKRSGRNYLGLCPFHGERTPSFNVNPERQIFRCFGCGEGGDVFSFIMKSSHLTFPEALQQLAERYGVPLPDRRPEDDDKAPMKEANDLAMGFYRRMLEHEEIGAKARAYLAERGVGPELQARFQLGYAPPHWDALYRYLLEKKIPASIQEKAALVRVRQSGSGHYDYFRNRVIFPITSEAGNVVGFGARAIDAGDEPKYLNSPETALYHKGNLLYGLAVAREAIKTQDEAILMEGYMDVITAHAYGITNAIGVLGTALTPAQARALLRYTPSKRVVLAFDADKAGQAAAERGLTTLSDVTTGVGLEVRVLSVPEGKDPDAFLRKEGAEAFRELLAAAPNWTQFLLMRALSPFDLRTDDGRLKAVAACVPVLRQIENHVTQDYYVNWLSQLVGLREESIRLEIKRGMRHNVTPSRGAQLMVKKLSAREAEQILLYLMVEHPRGRQAIRDQLGEMAFEPIHQEIRERIEQLAATRGTATWEDLLDGFAGQEAQKTVSAIMFADYGKWSTEPDALLEDCINTLLFTFWEGELGHLKARLKQEEATLSRDELVALTARYKELYEYCVQLKHKRSNLLTSSKNSPDEN
ncbi:DNA primase [compost metagenome]